MAGQFVYQGLDTNKRVTAVVEDYDSDRQMITLSNVNGYIKEGENLYNNLGTKALVVVNGQLVFENSDHLGTLSGELIKL